jgi:plastocyanin
MFMKRGVFIQISLLLAIAFVSGCGGQPSDATSKGSIEVDGAVKEQGSSPEVKLPASTKSGSLSGAVQFTGTASPPATLAMAADPYCAGQNPEGAKTETLVINSNSTVRNVFVYIKSDVPGNYPTPKEPILIDQAGCRYAPHVLGVQVGQPITILNSDATLHNVHALPTASKEFNLGMPIKGMKLTKSFAKPEVMVRMKCDVHPWMSAYVGVLPHPFFSVTDETGNFKIDGLPAGRYTVEAWHETLGTRSQKIDIAPDQDKSVSFSFAG